MRLINGDHLEERVRKIIKDYAQAAKDVNVVPGRVTFSSCGVIGLVQSEPTENAVLVVRCKDCRWRDNQDGSTAWMPCRALVTPNDFYCPRGEQKDGGGNG